MEKVKTDFSLSSRHTILVIDHTLKVIGRWSLFYYILVIS